MNATTHRAALTAAVLLPLAVAASPVPQKIPGVFALAGASPMATASLSASPNRALPNSGDPGAPMTLDLTMTATGAKKPVQQFDPEPGGEALHVIAVDDALHGLVRAQGGGGVGKRGAVSTFVRFPHSGFYHVYADAAPAGLGRQVFRFELRVGTAQGASAPAAAAPLPLPTLVAADGPYTARFDPFTLTSGQEGMLTLHILRGGQPAPDLTPYLGAAAQAVLISARDLSYVPVQVQGSDVPASNAQGHTREDTPPDLALHVAPPKPGPYRLWLQFMAGGQVRTAAFTIEVR